MSKALVIVESPAKARTISQFLGKEYHVTASYGHVRDLPEKAADVPKSVKDKPWGKLGVNIEGNFEPVYVVSSDKKRHVDSLKEAAKGATRVLLATDEDREGESISWHILQVLKPKKDVTVERIVFHEITPEAIRHALDNPRAVDEALVKAQETRRVLDRLYGYTLSPLLWKKVAPKLSAGRVQSVAVRLVVMRERERRSFVSVDYSSILATLTAQKGEFKAKLQSIAQAKVADGQSFSDSGELIKSNENWLTSNDAATIAIALTIARPWTVTDVSRKPGVENPPVPFMTSTLQQEANRKHGFTARRTMQIAQNLYEGVDCGSGPTGLITYMRTDSLNLAERAVQDARKVVQSMYGKEFLPAKPPVFKNKSKNAQEAHEAIRPTDLQRTPQSIKQYLSDEQFKLYDLIWKRTLACQMAPAKVERTKVTVEVKNSSTIYSFGASGKAIVFPGFLRAYVEGSDDPNADLDDKETLLPEIKSGEIVDPTSITAQNHQTTPPARYTEASLVRKLEDEGIGRPSTYASIISTIQDRGYVQKLGGALVPTFTAFAVTELLENNFPDLINIKFTAEMENQLDEIADGSRDMVQHLRDFYFGTGDELGIAEKVEKHGPDMPFPLMPIGEDIVVRIGRNGPFIQRGEGGPGNTASVPEDLPPAELTLEKAKELLEMRAQQPSSIGQDPATGRDIYAKTGRFGAYLEIAATEEETTGGLAPRRITLPPGVSAQEISTEDLGLLLTYPRNIGAHPESGADIILQSGRFGPYLTAGDQKANAGDWRAAAIFDLAAAVALLADGGANKRAKASALKELGESEGLEGPVKVMSGRYGPYVTDGKTNATIPRGFDPESVTLQQATEWIKTKMAAGPSKKRRGKFVRKK